MADLDKYLEDLGINVNEEESSLAAPDLDKVLNDEFANQDVSIVTPPEIERTSMDKCIDFLNPLLFIIDPEYRVEVRQSASGDLKVGIHGGDSARLIGKNGYTLMALEYITNIIVNHDLESRVRVLLDVSNYRYRREERLRATARKLVEHVRNTNNPLELEPMAANERRIIHLEISKQQNVISQSVGDGRNRRVIIKPMVSET